MGHIGFNKPYLQGKELKYITEAVNSGKISGNGLFTKKCQGFFEEKYGFNKCLLTTSCTDALEMTAILMDIEPGDEVIIPSYTFVSTANAYVLRGAKIVFADSNSSNPNVDISKIAALITPKTKAIIVVHYAGFACDMDAVMSLANKHKLYVVEDAAQAIDSFYKGKPLGGIGHFGTFSFHETKNIMCGEGGMLIINDASFIPRAEVIWEKGTNRAAFWRGEIDKYTWIDVGSSFLPSEITAAFLLAQLEEMEQIQDRRKELWNVYYSELKEEQGKGHFLMPEIPEFATNNAHMFYLLLGEEHKRDALIDALKKKRINAVSHYHSLHGSIYYKEQHDDRVLINSDKYSQTLVRLPLFYELSDVQQKVVIDAIKEFFN